MSVITLLGTGGLIGHLGSLMSSVVAVVLP